MTAANYLTLDEKVNSYRTTGGELSEPKRLCLHNCAHLPLYSTIRAEGLANVHRDLSKPHGYAE